MKPLDRKTWQRLTPLLDKALDLPEAERDAFVQRVLEGEPDLQRILRELITAERRADDLLETPIAGLAGNWRAESAASSTASSEAIPQVDGYEDLREIGRGGMGVVYGAIRRGEGYEQLVALKVVRSGLDESALRRRFEQERSILARLEHPHIARLVDGGTTKDGRSYFAMEYVDGVSITHYADRHRLGVSERLRLFEDVCRAVAFAQQQLVVHRDLKPSNILVDTEGRVRLLDFGIARLIDPENEGASEEMTVEGARLLTPDYAAPEQVRGEAPSTATDVYALGVILFELLSGRHPLGRTHDAALEFAMGTRESEWLPRAVDREHRELGEDGTVEVITSRQVAQARGLSPRALRRLLGGDLATIAAKALQRLPTDRYPSAEALLADLASYREGRPIAARPPSWSYRTRKYLQRHRTAISAVALVVLALGIGLGISLWQARVAQREAQRAGRAYEFLAGLFQDAHPDAAQGTDYTASELLERGSVRLTDAWPDDPEAREALQQQIARIMTERGDYESAREMLQEVLTRDDVVDRVALMLSLARVELYRQDPAAADSLLKAIDTQLDPLTLEERNTFLESAASISYQQGAYAQAESLQREVMVLTLEQHGARSSEYVSDLNNLGSYQSAQANYEEAEHSQLMALDLCREVHPGIHTKTALVLHNLGDQYNKMGRHEDAILALQEAVGMRRVLYPNGHDRLAESLRGLSMAERAMGRLDVADSLLTESVEMIAVTVGESGEAFARQLNEYAILAYLRADYEAARERFVRALAIFEVEMGPTHPITLTVANNLATVQTMTGHLEEALVTYRQVLERRVEVLGDRHEDVAFSHNSIGSVLRRLERSEESIPMHLEALERYIEIYGEQHNLVAATRTYLGSSYRELGRTDEAFVEYRKALAFREAELPASHRDIIDTRLSLGYAQLQAGEWASALATLETVEREIAASTNATPHWLASAQAAKGLSLARLGRIEEGRALTEAAWESLHAEFGPEDTITKRALGYLEQIDRP